MLDELARDHDNLRAIADQLERYLHQPHPPVDVEFSRLRWSLIRQLTIHLAREQAAFATNAMAGELGCLDQSLDARLNDYMATWDVAAIQQRWAHYCSASRALLNQLRYRMKREEAYVFPRLVPQSASGGRAAFA